MRACVETRCIRWGFRQYIHFEKKSTTTTTTTKYNHFYTEYIDLQLQFQPMWKNDAKLFKHTLTHSLTLTQTCMHLVITR